MTTMTKRTVPVIVALAVAADVVTKAVAVRTLTGDPVDLGVIDLRLVYNEGVAFGLGDSAPPVLLLGVIAAVTIALSISVWKGALPAGVPVALLLGGAIANLVDRAAGGSVVDMFDLGWWPAFNIADVCIVVGVAGLLLQSVRPPDRVVQESA